MTNVLHFEFGVMEPELPPIDVFRLDTCDLDSLRTPAIALQRDLKRLQRLDEYHDIRDELDVDPTMLIRYQVEHPDTGGSADDLALEMLENRNLDRVCRNCYPRQHHPVIAEEAREKERTLTAVYFGVPAGTAWPDIELAKDVYLNTRWMLDDAVHKYQSTARDTIGRLLKRAGTEYIGVPAMLLSYWQTLYESPRSR